MTLPPCCLSLDLEVGKADGRIHAFAGVRADSDRRVVYRGGDLSAALAELDGLADGASFVLGHNLVAFDLPHLMAAKPGLRLLRLPAVDTLRLGPLAFPGNPYHRLVKHYRDGGLKRGRRNDPELDARLALEVFGDQRRALREAAPELLAAWHWLSTPEPENRDRALDALFSELRGSPRPVEAEALAAIDGRLTRHLLRDPRTRDRGRGGGLRLGSGLCAGLVVGGGRQLRHAALGAPPIPRGGSPGAPAQGQRLRPSRLRLVP